MSSSSAIRQTDTVVRAVLDQLLGMPGWLALAAVFLLPALEASTLLGVVLPGETALLIGGVFAHGGRLELWEVMLAGATGAVVGDSAGYLIGRHVGPRLLGRLTYRLSASQNLGRATGLIRRHGAIAVLLGRWTASLRAFVPIVAGASGLRYGRFAVANVVGGVTWAGLVTYLGFIAGAGYRTIEQRLGIGELVVLVGGLVLLAVFAIRARRRRRDWVDGRPVDRSRPAAHGSPPPRGMAASGRG